MKNNIPPVRPDFTQGLVHLTRSRKGTKRHFDHHDNDKDENKISAFNVLKEILSEGIIKGSTTASGFIKGSTPAVCFSEIPLWGLRYFAQEEGGRYEFYGLVFAKRTMFDKGARPVIYLPDDEGNWIPDAEKWRQVRFDPLKGVDWTFEREWRLKGDLNLSSIPGFYVITHNWHEAEELRNLKKPDKVNVRGLLPMDHILLML